MSEALLGLHQEVRGCQLCVLSRTRTQAVPGDGDPAAKIMIVGEAPGQNEDKQGLPFVGAAGQLLNQLLSGIGIERKDVYITNIVKCRPPGNRDPLPEEVGACSGYLDRQVEYIRPAVILLLGRHALQRLLPGSSGISRVHGQMVQRGDRAYVPLYHPAAALYNNFLLDTLRQDFSRVRDYIAEIEARRAAAAPAATDTDPKEQLSLF
ncbi:MAG TPA: uracil-DNA glycosylase [Candidatus Dormibacteraeota bacterium]|nr:uracil-DNA glycosylase [Candidatus Dormibacteraeota bacterium]